MGNTRDNVQNTCFFEFEIYVENGVNIFWGDLFLGIIVVVLLFKCVFRFVVVFFWSNRLVLSLIIQKKS